MAPLPMLHALPRLMEQPGQSQCVCRPARPSAADFVDPVASLARLCPVCPENPANVRTNGPNANPVKTNG